MNSTSAWERGGRLARVERGSVLLGCPGAPGWTITGGAAAEDEGGEGADCQAFIEDGEKINMEVLAANSRPFLRQDFRQVVVNRFDINWSSRLTLRMPEYLELPRQYCRFSSIRQRGDTNTGTAMLSELLCPHSPGTERQ
jgi:hypothetical protein